MCSLSFHLFYLYLFILQNQPPGMSTSHVREHLMGAWHLLAARLGGMVYSCCWCRWRGSPPARCSAGRPSSPAAARWTVFLDWLIGGSQIELQWQVTGHHQMLDDCAPEMADSDRTWCMQYSCVGFRSGTPALLFVVL